MIQKRNHVFLTSGSFLSKKIAAGPDNDKYVTGALDGTPSTGEPDIMWQSVVYVKEPRWIWTHGILYEIDSNSAEIYNTLVRLAKESENGGVIFFAGVNATGSRVLLEGQQGSIRNVFYYEDTKLFGLAEGLNTFTGRYFSSWANKDLWIDANGHPYENRLYVPVGGKTVYIYNASSGTLVPIGGEIVSLTNTATQYNVTIDLETNTKTFSTVIDRASEEKAGVMTPVHVNMLMEAAKMSADNKKNVEILLNDRHRVAFYAGEITDYELFNTSSVENADSSEVYWLDIISSFVFKPNKSSKIVVKNWGNRNIWIDNNLCPYNDTLYVCLEEKRISIFVDGELVDVVGPADGCDCVIDDTLDKDSNNAVANKAIFEALKSIEQSLSLKQDKLSDDEIDAIGLLVTEDVIQRIDNVETSFERVREIAYEAEELADSAQVSANRSWYESKQAKDAAENASNALEAIRAQIDALGSDAEGADALEVKIAANRGMIEANADRITKLESEQNDISLQLEQLYEDSYYVNKIKDSAIVPGNWDFIKTPIKKGERYTIKFSGATIGDFISFEYADDNLNFADRICSISDQTDGSVSFVPTADYGGIRIYNGGKSTLKTTLSYDEKFYDKILSLEKELEKSGTAIFTPTIYAGAINNGNGSIDNETKEWGLHCFVPVEPLDSITFKGTAIQGDLGWAFYNGTKYVTGGHYDDLGPTNTIGDITLRIPVGVTKVGISWNKNFVSADDQCIEINRGNDNLKQTIIETTLKLEDQSVNIDKINKTLYDVEILSAEAKDGNWELINLKLEKDVKYRVEWSGNKTNSIISTDTANEDALAVAIYNIFYTKTESGSKDFVPSITTTALRIYAEGGALVKIYRYGGDNLATLARQLEKIEGETIVRPDNKQDGAILASDGSVDSSLAWYASYLVFDVEVGQQVTFFVTNMTDKHGYAFYKDGVFVSGGIYTNVSPSIPTGYLSMIVPNGVNQMAVCWNRNFGSYNIVIRSSLQIVREQTADAHALAEDAIRSVNAIMPYRGKKILSIGDSYTMMNFYGKYLEQVTGAKQRSRGCNGQTLMHMVGDYYNPSDNWEESRYEPFNKTLLEQFDIVTVMGGTNDYGQNTQAGKVSDPPGANSIAGHLKYAINKILTACPTVKLIVCTQPYRAKHNNFHHGLGGYDLNNPKDEEGNPLPGCNLEGVADIMVAVCRSLSIPCLDFYHESGWNEYNNKVTNPENGEPGPDNVYPPFNDNRLTVDGIHPRDGEGNGAQQLGFMLGQFINSH